MSGVRVATMVAMALPNAAMAMDVSIDGACPGPVTIEVTGITPGGEWALMFGSGLGADPLPAALCGGASTELAGLTVRMPLRLDGGAGTATLNPTMSGGACGSYVQLIDVATCDLSNVAQIPANACRISGRVSAEVTFDDPAAFDDPNGLAWDGYGSFLGDALAATDAARVDALGTLDATWSTASQHTGLFTHGDGLPGLYAREAGSSQLLQIDTLAAAVPVTVLGGAAPPADANVVYDAIGGQYLAHDAAVLHRWSADGSPAGDLPLSGFGSMAGEATAPASTRIATASGCALTYSNGRVSAWDGTGRRSGAVRLEGAGTTPESYASFSYAKGLAWVLDEAGGTWRGYDIGLADAPAWSFGSPVDADLTDYPEETRFVTSGGTSTWVSWTEDDVNVAINHPDVRTGGDQHWVVLYLGNGSGSAPVGPVHNTQEPALPFGASHVVRWKANDSYNSLLTWDGGAWVETSWWLGTDGSDVAEFNDWDNVEFRIPRAAIGATDTLELVVALVYEGSGYESTYAVLPGGALGGAASAYDPDFTEFYRFDLAHPNPPNATWPSLATP